MGWSIGYDTSWQRDIGYGVPAVCDSPACNEKIDRGLSYVCGSEPCGGGRGCGLYFCGQHLRIKRGRKAALCTRCENYRAAYDPKPDVPEWIHHKATDPSWAAWRQEQAEKAKTP